jgi:hypothetical protein
MRFSDATPLRGGRHLTELGRIAILSCSLAQAHAVLRRDTLKRRTTYESLSLLARGERLTELGRIALFGMFTCIDHRLLRLRPCGSPTRRRIHLRGAPTPSSARCYFALCYLSWCMFTRVTWLDPLNALAARCLGACGCSPAYSARYCSVPSRTLRGAPMFTSVTWLDRSRCLGACGCSAVP